MMCGVKPTVGSNPTATASHEISHEIGVVRWTHEQWVHLVCFRVIGHWFVRSAEFRAELVAFSIAPSIVPCRS